MIIGHLPTGYLAARALERSFDEDPLVWWAILLGSVAPDFDMLWFVFVDHGTVHHHTYITHDPTLWVGVLGTGLLVASRLLIGLGLGALLHLSLDTIAGAITWGYGRVSFSGPLVEVPAVQSHWILNFLLHWTFAVEITFCLIAGGVFWRRRRKRASGRTRLPNPGEPQ
ncbi:metal-dependent hydrolase [Roseobacteraceae bacterium S113]